MYLTCIYVDGTFNYCSKFFHQMFIIHGFINNYYIPLAFFLIPDKETNSYLGVFNYINEKCLKFNLEFSLNYIYADFEKAIHRAASQVWPTADIIGCSFHLG